MAHRIESKRDNVYVPGVGVMQAGEQGVVTDRVHEDLEKNGHFGPDGLLIYVEDVTVPGEVTSYSQVRALTGYPATFPADPASITPEAIGAQPAGDYATSDALAALAARVDALENPPA